MQHDVVFAMHPAADALPRRLGQVALCAASFGVNTRITGNTAGTASPASTDGRLVAGGGGVGGDRLGVQTAGERAVPDGGHRHLAHSR